MKRTFAVIGVGNMARAIIGGILSSDIDIECFCLYDKNKAACSEYFGNSRFYICESIAEAVKKADCVLLSIKPQNYAQVLDEISFVEGHTDKLYISIGAGITTDSVASKLGTVNVLRVLPNLPMTIGLGVSAICRNELVNKADFDFVASVFASAGSTIVIDESEMNRVIGVTSSSPAYVFKFINAICEGASTQGLDGDAMLSAICDVVIGSATLLKQSSDTPKELISKVASKGGTTEQALLKLEAADFDTIMENAMIACTNRADELGKK